jgi:hypothetical protein
MAKVTGNLRVTATTGSSPGQPVTAQPYFEVVFVPYAGRLNTIPVKARNYDDLISLLIELKLGEDDAARWAGKARSQGVILIPSIERSDVFLKEKGLLA